MRIDIKQEFENWVASNPLTVTNKKNPHYTRESLFWAFEAGYNSGQDSRNDEIKQCVRKIHAMNVRITKCSYENISEGHAIIAKLNDGGCK